MTALIASDVSEFQTYLTDQYGRRLLILRVSFGAHYQDPKFLHDAAVAAEMYRKGEIDGVILYVVYLATATPEQQYAFTWKLIGPTVPPWLVAIMIDVEHWGGTSYSISGDHSRQLNTLYGLHAHKMGHWSACIGYGNKSDLAAIWPHRDTRCAVILAEYSSSLSFRGVANVLGKQYTDGTDRFPVPSISGKALPRASAPFGRCDHNVFPAFASAKALRAKLRPAAAAAPAPAPRPVVPAAAAPHYPAPLSGGVNELISKSRAWASFLMDDGRIDVRHNGVHHHYLPAA